jgi:hypothetical protein
VLVSHYLVNDKAVDGLPILIPNLPHKHLLCIYRPETKALTLEELDYGPSHFFLPLSDIHSKKPG